MRFFAPVAALVLAAVVSAQDSTSAEPTATSASLTPQQTCLAGCGTSDICCQAACVNVPCPNESQVNATTECAGQCTQGNGTQQETDAYASCQASCVSSYFLTTTAGGAAATSGPSSASATATSGNSASASASEASETGSSATSSASDSAASASATGNSASEMRATVAGAGLFGLIIAGLAL